MCFSCMVHIVRTTTYYLRFLIGTSLNCEYNPFRALIFLIMYSIDSTEVSKYFEQSTIFHFLREKKS